MMPAGRLCRCIVVQQECIRLTSPAYAGVRAGADVAGGGRTRRGALQTWRPGALPGGRRGGAGGRGGQRC